MIVSSEKWMAAHRKIVALGVLAIAYAAGRYS
jgi:hypothetical protein